MTGMKPRVTGEAVSVYSFSNWCLFIPDFVSLSVYRLHPLKGAALLRIDADMVTALGDCFYGGTGARLPFNRQAFTPTEEQLLQNFSAYPLEKPAEYWAKTHPVHPHRGDRKTTK